MKEIIEAFVDSKFCAWMVNLIMVASIAILGYYAITFGSYENQTIGTFISEHYGWTLLVSVPLYITWALTKSYFWRKRASQIYRDSKA